eukprot:7377182-Prymnesium_polylepis.1
MRDEQEHRTPPVLNDAVGSSSSTEPRAAEEMVEGTDERAAPLAVSGAPTPEEESDGRAVATEA